MKPLSRGAEHLWKLLRWYKATFGRVYPTQAKLAGRIGVTVRQIQRYLKELVEALMVRVLPCGPNSSEYLLSDQAIERENVVALSPLCRGFVAASPSASLLLSGSVSVSRSVPRKPPKRQTAYERATERFLREGAQPPVYLTNEYGRRDINPAWQEWRDREIRISRADNPIAYRRAILRQERAG